MATGGPRGSYTGSNARPGRYNAGPGGSHDTPEGRGFPTIDTRKVSPGHSETRQFSEGVGKYALGKLGLAAHTRTEKVDRAFGIQYDKDITDHYRTALGYRTKGDDYFSILENYQTNALTKLYAYGGEIDIHTRVQGAEQRNVYETRKFDVDSGVRDMLIGAEVERRSVFTNSFFQ